VITDLDGRATITCAQHNHAPDVHDD
jgi:hypothetical protein